MKPKKPRWLRWLKWTGVFILCWVTVVPTIQAVLLRQRVLSALRSGNSVRLEEFVLGHVISKVHLDTTQIGEVKSAMPVVPDIGLPGMITLCFFPHHRVVITDKEARELSFDVCFGCEEMRFAGGAIMMTPYLWQSRLRRLFLRHQIPVREQREYMTILNERSQMKSAEQE